MHLRPCLKKINWLNWCLRWCCMVLLYSGVPEIVLCDEIYCPKICRTRPAHCTATFILYIVNDLSCVWRLLLNEYWLIDWIPDCGCWHYALPSRSGVSSLLCSLHCTHIWHNPSDIPRTHPELLSAFTEINGIITILKVTSCARGDTICPRPSLPPWAPQRLARRRADAT